MTRLSFGSAEWLALLPIVLLVAWRWRALAAWQPLRVTLVVLLFLALAEPRLALRGAGMDLWVLVDRSASVSAVLEPRRAEIETLLERARRHDDRLFFVDFSDSAAVRASDGSVVLGGTPNETRLASAVRYALAQATSGRPARLLLLSDGFSTEPLGALAERLTQGAIPLDYRLFTLPQERDVRIAQVLVPQRVQSGEAFLIEVQLAADQDASVPLAVERDGRRLGQTRVALRSGHGVVRFSERLTQGGAHRYRFSADVPGDPITGNNHSEAWVEVAGASRVLLVTSFRPDPLADALRSQKLDVEVVSEPATLGVGRLSGARAVILNNVPAFRLPREFLAALDGFVRAQGQGLLMVGGRGSFGSGGYFASPIDGLLPVSMELKQEHRKLAVAIAFVLDRSGSMAASVGGDLTKMDLANEGTARSIELLGSQDLVAVFAVDSEAHRIVSLGSLGENRGEIMDAVRRIGSAGGGIFVYTGLAAAWQDLRRAPYGQRHVVLFADAADSEEPGRYQELLAEMAAQRTTVSVIGLGSEGDSDAAFLKDVAARGGGRIVFAADPNELPALFTQETVTLARSAFLTDPVGVRSTGGWGELAARPLDGLARVGGYNLSYLRPGATAALVATDEYAAPLLAFWQRGSGRAAAVCFPLAGEQSLQARSWPQYGDFVQTLARWLVGADAPAGAGLRTRTEGTHLVVELLYDDRWLQTVAEHTPEIVLVEGLGPELRTLSWERLRRGHLVARVPLRSDQWYRGAVRIGGHTLSFGPIAGPVGAEWSFDAGRRQALLAAAAASGGRERVDLASAWEAPPAAAPREIRIWLLAVFLALFVLEALRTRLNWIGPSLSSLSPLGRALARSLERRKAQRVAGGEGAPPVSVPLPPEQDSAASQTSIAPAAPSESDRRTRRLLRAKKRGH